MTSTSHGVALYGPREAESYDHRSGFDKGSRALHRDYLRDLVSHLVPGPVAFLDLGCGTGYLTEAFWEADPASRGVAVDGSAAMLAQARARLASYGAAVDFRESLLQEVPWSELPPVDVVFSSLVVHFLEDHEKREMFTAARRQLRPGGVFILFAQHEPRSPTAARLMQVLACRDIQRRVGESLGIPPELSEAIDELRLDHILDEDTRMRREEGAHDLEVDEYRALLSRVGFEEVITVFQETRYFGVVALTRSTHQGPAA
ncbi:MAG TPA: methyltransferase domain-containing protein [Longimicrobium sp.]|jgi:ubiquinone/menaquinone biosynthesis C-methylase UbiE|uniref:class I SAM-dependent methyltransferase n=1 Tax=Longimicrobium sp. TaxID=2029185 RepID=UPI002ED9D33E